MNTYTVLVSPVAKDQIDEYARYISDISGMPRTAAKWLRNIYDRIATLDAFPQRHALAEEDTYVDYEVRRQIIGVYLVLYSIDEECRTVHVVGFRHGHRRPRPEELAAPRDL